MALRVCRYSVAALLMVGLAAASAAPLAADPTPAKTAKERLTGKAADEQRVDDCKVPVAQRGDSRRPADCAHITNRRFSVPSSGQKLPK